MGVYVVVCECAEGVFYAVISITVAAPVHPMGLLLAMTTSVPCFPRNALVTSGLGVAITAW